MQHKLFILGLFILWTFTSIGQKSFSVDEAQAYAIANSIETKKNQINSVDANARVKEFKSIGMPSVNAFVNYQYFPAVPTQPLQDFIGPSIYGVLFAEGVIPQRDLGPPDVFQFTFVLPNQLSAGIEANQLLFDGSYLYGLKAAKFYRELVQRESDVSEFNTKNQVLKAYASILIAEENKIVISQNITNIKKSLDEFEALYKNGFAEMLDVERLTLSYDNLNNELNKIDQLILLSKNLLKFQMNYPLDEDIILTENLNDLISKYQVLSILDEEELSFSSRPEYGVIETGQKLNDLDYKRTKAGYLPSARAFASAQANLLRNNLFDNDETGFIPQALVGLSVNIPIYDGGDKSAKLQRIKLNQEKTEYDKYQFEQSVRLQTQNAKIQYSMSLTSLANGKKALDINQSIYNKTLIKFKEGIGSSLEVTQAESSLLQAQAAYTNALYDQLNAIIQLKEATGL